MQVCSSAHNSHLLPSLRYAAQCRSKISSLWALPKTSVVGVTNSLPLGDSFAADMEAGKLSFQVRALIAWGEDE
jgi:hypothetical protein